MGSSRRRIAVVDDEPSIRRALDRLMRSADMDVDTYPSGAEFLAAWSCGAPDCVVLDLHMPGLTGFDVLERLTQSDARVPVVVVTGHDTPEARALASGASAYLLKPVDDGALLSAIDAAIRGRRSAA